MADYDRRGRGRGGYHDNRRKRYRDDDDFDRRPQRRRYEEPLPVRMRRQLLSIAESPLKPVEEETYLLAKLVSDNYDDVETRESFIDLSLQIITEQPFKIPFVAGIIIVINGMNRGEDIVLSVLGKAAQETERRIAQGEWREVKLLLKFLGCLQPLFADEGVWPTLNVLFERAADLQTASSEDTLGMELVKVILFTIPYIMASNATASDQQAAALLEKTDILAGTPSPLEALVDPYPGNGVDEESESTSVIGILQKQLQAEAARGWPLSLLPRPWKPLPEMDSEDPLTNPAKHTFPPIAIPPTVVPGVRPLFPEIFFSVYDNQDVETVPPTTDIASCILRDSIVDTINILDFNRIATARYLIDIDCYFSNDTFVKRATPFDRLRDLEGGRSTWKPEDVAVDAVFSQLFQLPAPEHKLVYYHSVLTEACKIAPAAIAPSLGRAIRYLYRNVDRMDLELAFRFMDWFSHHLSNFGFTWKWTEWTDDVELPPLHPKKAFIAGALDKEVRLSFAQRIKGTLPEPYQPLITEGKEKDTPDFKYNEEDTPFSTEGKEMLALLKKKATEDEIQPVIEQIETQARTLALPEPILASTDPYVTAICYVGSKSLSHLLLTVERCRERLLNIGNASESARRQIISSVMAYWHDQPGIGVNIVDKLLNFAILTPESVIEWCLVDDSGAGDKLSETHVYEMVANTVQKVTNRLHQIVSQRNAPGLEHEQKLALDETLLAERVKMQELFQRMEEILVGWASGSKDQAIEAGLAVTEDEKLIRQWGERWLRVFRRKMAAEEAFLIESGNRQVQQDGAEVVNGNDMDVEV